MNCGQPSACHLKSTSDRPSLKDSQNKSWKRCLRILLLILLLLVALAAYYYYTQKTVRFEVVQFKSNLVGKTLPYGVVLPPGYGLITTRRIHYPVLYLLHGWSGDYNSWIKQTALMQYAAEYQMIIITPEGGNAWYTDSATVPSDQYEAYVMRELISDVDSRFRTIPDRRGRSIAGVSMGGYGALKFGFKHPEKFSLAASMSGALDATARTDDASIMQAFGEPESAARKSNDLSRLAREFPADRQALLPYFYLDCGTEDPWLMSNRDFSGLLLERKIVHEYRQLPGNHVWPHWDRQVREVMRIAAERMVAAER
jgi:S-formylglutathione hydrolase FrmB